MCVFAMFSVLLLISAAELVGANDFTMRCTNDSESSKNGMTFEPVSKDIVGRYKLELCTDVKPEYKQWEVVVSFLNKTSTCVNDWKLLYQFKSHSSNIEYIHIDNNCTHACLTKDFDLIFAACYSIESKFLTEEEDEYRSHPQPTTYTFNVNNSYTLAQFIANTVTVDFIPHENGITIIWHPGVPVQDFEVEVCNANVTDSEYDTLPCMNASASCSRSGGDRSAATVRCWLPMPAFCISVAFRHVAPWISGRLYLQGTAHIPYTYCPPSATPVDVNGSSWTGASAAGAVLAVAGVALLLRQLWSTRRALHARKHVLKLWLQTTSSETSPPASPTTKPSRHILLLYARENDAGQRVIDAFTAILQEATDGQVYSLYSARVMCVAGAAPGEWVRAALARPDLAVVLLQTPALRALYAAPGGDAGGEVTVSAPLFPRAVVPREPAFGDALLQYALRLVTDTDLAHSYHKLYIATLSELPTEVFPRLVPYRRYMLPEAASLLARDASGDFAPLPAPKATDNTAVSKEDDKEDKSNTLDVKQELLNEAVAYFVEVVKENPRYLMDELVVL